MILSLLLVASLPVQTLCSVELLVHVKSEHIDVSGSSAISSQQFDVSLRNIGPIGITLVEPGDGSDIGWRTPIVTWEVELVGGVYRVPMLGRCGNINPLRPEQVFDLKPGESRKLGVPNVWVSQPGRYRLRLRYVNDPALKWWPLGDHDEAAMRRVRNSTACVAISKEVQVEVTGLSKR